MSEGQGAILRPHGCRADVTAEKPRAAMAMMYLDSMVREDFDECEDVLGVVSC